MTPDDYQYAGAMRLRDLVFDTDPQTCLPANRVPREPSSLARRGVIESPYVEPRECFLEPVVVDFTTCHLNPKAKIVETQVLWASSVTGALYYDTGLPVAVGSTLTVRFK